MFLFYEISILIGRLVARRSRRVPPERPARTVTALLAGYPFGLDRFQVRALDALDAGRSVLVAAPTGSGKTVVAEYAVAKALAEGGKAFYTTPIKALSNQKYGDLGRRHGADEVGLLTGDNAINGDAPVVVMTTEVLRNMIYAGSPALDGLRYVVLDEVHYLQDAYRGPVWEEVIIHAPAGGAASCACRRPCRTPRSSPTGSRPCAGRPTAVIEETAAGRAATTCTWSATSARERPAPAAHARRRSAQPRGRAARRRPAPRPRSSRRVAARGAASSRPAGSRWSSGCATRTLLPGDLLHLQPRRVRRRRAAVPRRRAAADDARGAGAHPRHRRERTVERSPTPTSTCSATAAGRRPRGGHRRPPRRDGAAVQGGGRGVLRRRAGEGRCSPPRRWPSASTCRPASVVIEKLTKFTGERHEFLTPGEYTQLTGRAGRRGIDDDRLRGRAVVAVRAASTRWPGSRRAARSRSRRRSGRPTTWRPTSCGATTATRPTTC